MNQSKPNLLFIYTDEQAINTLAAYGNDQINMPNLNKLAKVSTVFSKAYVTQPVCTPSRSTLLTGLYPHTNGCTKNNVPLKPDTPCLPEMLNKDEYITAHYGKWHLGDELYKQHGFDHWVSIEDNYNEFFSDGLDKNVTSSYHQFLIQNGFTPNNGDRFSRGEASRLPEKFGKPAFLAKESSIFIKEHQASPFVLYVNFLEPHMPFFGPRDNQYDPKDMPLPTNFDNKLDDSNPLKTNIFAAAYEEGGHSGLPLKSKEDWQKMISNYWGLNSLIDTHIGSILDTLEECHLTDNTIIVFTSDHGDMMGSHKLLAKCVMFEEAVRVPLLIKMPGQTIGKRIENPVSQIDIVPTLLELMNQPIPPYIQGESLCKTINAEHQIDENKNVYIEWNGSNSGIIGEGEGNFKIPSLWKNKITEKEVSSAVQDLVRTVITPDGWKLNYSPLGEHELYNLSEDPGECINVFTVKENRSLIEKLIGEILCWQKRVNDTTELPSLV